MDSEHYRTRPPQHPRAERIMQYSWGYAPTIIIDAAVQHGVFDVLDTAPAKAGELAERAGISERGARAVLDALVGLELLTHDGKGVFSLTPESREYLVRGKPSFFGDVFQRHTRDTIPRWLELREVVRTGKPAVSYNQEGQGTAFFEQLVPALFPVNYPAAGALAAELLIERLDHLFRVLDLAAGSGVWGIVLAERSPKVEVTAVDWPGVIPVTKSIAARHGVEDRFTFVEGDILEAPLGSGFDLAILGHILHSEGERRSKKILERTFQALAPGGRVVIAEFLTSEDRSEPVGSLLFAVNMLVHSDEGTTYTVDELRRWLVGAGFANVRFVEAPGPSPLVLADKPGKPNR